MLAKHARGLALDGDGKLDIASAGRFVEESTALDTVGVLLASGEGSFSAETEYPTGQTPVAVVGDVNGDGTLDIAAGFAASSVLFGAGDGTFPSSLDYLFIGDSFVLGDVNGDGSLDLVAAGPASLVTVLLNSCR